MNPPFPSLSIQQKGPERQEQYFKYPITTKRDSLYVPCPDVPRKNVENANPVQGPLRPQAVEEAYQRVLRGRVARAKRHAELSLNAVDDNESDLRPCPATAIANTWSGLAPRPRWYLQRWSARSKKPFCKAHGTEIIDVHDPLVHVKRRFFHAPARGNLPTFVHMYTFICSQEEEMKSTDHGRRATGRERRCKGGYKEVRWFGWLHLSSKKGAF